MAWAWPGGYPLYYFNENTGEVSCPDCASREVRGEYGPENTPTHVEVNYEDDSLECGNCGIRIESAYGEDLEMVEHGYREGVRI
jgi:DNA-directed RNA polymerase subunit RPC12/RpoP